MPNTYKQIYIQVVFATKGRDVKIKSEVRTELKNIFAEYLTIKNKKF